MGSVEGYERVSTPERASAPQDAELVTAAGAVRLFIDRPSRVEFATAHSGSRA